MEQKIINLFTKNTSLPFNQIEKKLEVRSNKLSYHLKKLVDKKILEKTSSGYSLSKNSEYLIPYISENKAVIPVVLIRIGENNSIFLVKREKHPYKDIYGLPGGRILLGESVEKAAKRIMKNKFNIFIKSIKKDKIALEQVKKYGKIIHSFILILVTAKTENEIAFQNVEKIKKKMIKSDYKLLKSKSKSILQTIISRI